MKLVMPPAAGTRFVGDVGFLGQAGLTEVHLVVDHAGEQPQAAGVDHFFAGARVKIAGDGFDAALFYAYVRVETAAFVDQFGMLDQPFSGHGVLLLEYGNDGK